MCHGQFFYTDYQIGEEWLKTNSGNFNVDSSDTSNLWYNYVVNKVQENDKEWFYNDTATQVIPTLYSYISSE